MSTPYGEPTLLHYLQEQAIDVVWSQLARLRQIEEAGLAMRSGPKQGFAALQELTNALGATTTLETRIHDLRHKSTTISREITALRHKLQHLRVKVDHSVARSRPQHDSKSTSM